MKKKNAICPEEFASGYPHRQLCRFLVTCLVLCMTRGVERQTGDSCRPQTIKDIHSTQALTLAGGLCLFDPFSIDSSCPFSQLAFLLSLLVVPLLLASVLWVLEKAQILMSNCLSSMGCPAPSTLGSDFLSLGSLNGDYLETRRETTSKTVFNVH